MLIIDNYDSFTYNIVQYVKMLGVEPIVVKNDEMTLDEIRKLDFSKIILSPGWGNPGNSGLSMQVIDAYKNEKPIFGICLGMQCIAQYFGAQIVKAPEPCHGKNSAIYFDKGFPLFCGLRQGFSATRYHSLMVSVDSVTDGAANALEISARTAGNIPMALRVKGAPIFGVQFHPEAILTENGIDIIRNFVNYSVDVAVPLF